MAYSWHIYWLNNIDYKKSVWCRYNRIIREFKEDVEVDSKEDLKAKNLVLLLNDRPHNLYPKKLVIKDEFDFISLKGIAPLVLCSEKLKNEILEAQIENFHFKEIDFEVVNKQSIIP